MRPAAISNVRRCLMRSWLTSLALAAVIFGCAASRPPSCEPGGRKNGSGSATAGRALIGIAEVLVGAELTDHDDEMKRQGINWTRGCISLISRDIRELYDTIPVGTAVVIER